MSNLVTKIEVQKKNKERVNIFVNEEFFIACDMSLVYMQGIKKGEEIDKEKINNIISILQIKSIKITKGGAL